MEEKVGMIEGVDEGKMEKSELQPLEFQTDAEQEEIHSFLEMYFGLEAPEQSAWTGNLCRYTGMISL